MRAGRCGRVALSFAAMEQYYQREGRDWERYAWIKAPNDAFGGRSALDVMLGGEMTDLMRVRRYLDAERGGW